MCMACEEMDMYYAYLAAVEAEKRKRQDWQCEVILFPQDGQPRAADATPAANPASSSPFACDEAE